MSDENIHIVVGIPTYRRPAGLRRALLSLTKQDFRGSLSVIVIDNDIDEQAGIEVVLDLRAHHYPFPISARAESKRGISEARNAILADFSQHRTANFLAMMDDDQEASPQWLSALVAIQKTFEADCVGSRVENIFEGAERKWLQESIVYSRRSSENGSVPQLHATCGVLLKASVIERMGVNAFDTTFSMTGGGDTDFFTRCKKAGLTFAKAHNSIIYEVWPESRVTLQWALRRSFRGGQTWTRVRLKNEDLLWVITSEISAILVNLLLVIVLFPVNAWSPRRRVNSLLKLVREFGRLSALLGGEFKEYLGTHGK